MPLLVSLFTDATYQSTRDMVGILREHNDTVLVLGCSHHSKNLKIFESSDISVGVNVYEEVREQAKRDAELIEFWHDSTTYFIALF